MIKFLTKRNIPLDSRSHFLFPDPDTIRDIQQQNSAHLSSSGFADFCDRFTQVISHFDIHGIWKTTGYDRLLEYDEIVVEILLREGLRGSSRFRILDIGASDGSSTLHLMHSLRREFHKIMADAVILDRYVYLHKYSFFGIHEYRTSDNKRVLVKSGPVGLRLPAESHSRGFLSKLLAHVYIQQTYLSRSMNYQFSISLLNPKVVKNKGISAVEGNVLRFNKDFVNCFNLIRGSNVLNRVYYSSRDLKIAIQNIISYLRNGGVLLISREGNGTFWKKVDGKLSAIEACGKGSETTRIVESINNKIQINE